MSLGTVAGAGAATPFAGAAEGERAFAAEAAHRLLNPLTGLRLRLEDLGSRERSSAELGTEIERAIADVDRVCDELALLLRERAIRARRVAATSELGPVLDAAADRWRSRLGPSGRTLQVTEIPAAVVEVPGSVLTCLLDGLFAVVVAPCRGDVRLRVEAAPAYVRLEVRIAGTDLVGSSVGVDDRALRCLRERVAGVGGRLVRAGGRCGVDVLLPRARVALV